MNIPRLEYEFDLWNRGIDYVMGIDEAGRGPLAGPLVVAGVILNKSHFVNNDIEQTLLETYSTINDSKKISEKKRDVLYDFIIKNAILYFIEEIDNKKIDSWGIGKADQVAFYNIATNKNNKAQHILTDFFEIRGYRKEKQTNIVRGDSQSLSIASASIIAKVYRDRLMYKYDSIYPDYGFGKHKGYGTKFHIQKIQQLGMCDIHRKSFRTKG